MIYKALICLSVINLFLAIYIMNTSRRPLFGNGDYSIEMWVNAEPIIKGRKLDFEVTNRFWNHVIISRNQHTGFFNGEAILEKQSRKAGE